MEDRYNLRVATLDDVPALERLIADSARGLSTGDYSPAQVEAALGAAFGVDSDLINDRTYFVAVAAEGLVGCGGWSRRGTLFGSDKQPGRQSQLLVPGRDAARVRAFFVHPDWARRGIGRTLLERCEAEAKAAGFTRVELLATLPGRRLYAALGYLEAPPADYPLGDGTTIQFVPMSKNI